MPPPETIQAATFPPPTARPLRSNVPRLGALRSVDYVLVALGGLLVGLWAYSPVQARSTVLYVASELAHIAPWLAASVVTAAAARATSADALAARAFTGRQGRMILVAPLIGALLPFCSCGVIPLSRASSARACRSHPSWHSGSHRH